MTHHVALVVDDEPNLRHLLDEVLIDEGYEVHSVGSVGEAVEVLDGGLRPCTAIIDQRLPDLPGSSLIEWMRNDERFVDASIIAISAQHALLAGLPRQLHVQVVGKPFDLGRLLAAVHASCEAGASLAESQSAASASA